MLNRRRVSPSESVELLVLLDLFYMMRTAKWLPRVKVQVSYAYSGYSFEAAKLWPRWKLAFQNREKVQKEFIPDSPVMESATIEPFYYSFVNGL